MESTQENLCDRCTGLCCKYITLEIDKPTTKRNHDDVRWYLLHEGITLLIEKGRWLIKVPTVCTALDKKGRCTIYEARPKTCREYSTENCDFYTEYENWETEYIEVETPEEYEKYLESRKRKKKAKAAKASKSAKSAKADKSKKSAKSAKSAKAKKKAKKKS
ncbi:MAG: YkgJ family cysteine cluster protein [Candidatus Omnitrophica bacterium]|nr:YkgJ family cysteine cluster protein [Candidatus Omnitrophota bacterium]